MQLDDLNDAQRQLLLQALREQLGVQKYQEIVAEVGEDELLRFTLQMMQSSDQASQIHTRSTPPPQVPIYSAAQQPRSSGVKKGGNWFKNNWEVISGILVMYIVGLSFFPGEGKDLLWWHYLLALPIGLLVVFIYSLISMISDPGDKFWETIWRLLKYLGLPAGMIALGVYLGSKNLGGWAILPGIVYIIIAFIFNSFREDYSPWYNDQVSMYRVLTLNMWSGFVIGAGLILLAIVTWIF